MTRSSTKEPVTPPASVTPPCAKETPGAPTKPQARRPNLKASATKPTAIKPTAIKPAVTNPRRSARIALLNAPPAEEEASADPAGLEEESAAGETINCGKPAAGSEFGSDKREEEERSESDLSELSDGMLEQEIQARIQEAEKPLEEQLVVVRAELAVKTAERDMALSKVQDLESKFDTATAERDEALARLQQL
jgi:hypothetical protein